MKVKVFFLKYVVLFLEIDEDVGWIVKVRYKIEIGVNVLIK